MNFQQKINFSFKLTAHIAYGPLSWSEHNNLAIALENSKKSQKNLMNFPEKVVFYSIW